MEVQQYVARPYQQTLVEYLTKSNGIVYLPTGSGKTYVAILALKRFSQKMMSNIEDGGQRALFICNTVELARQQASYVKKCTNFHVGYYVGEQGTDNWNRSKWTDEIKKNQVLVGTAQVILDLFLQNYLELKSVSIVIIDECHHGTGRHPYHEFMHLFQMVPNNTPLPRVVGLTGVLMKGNEIKEVGKKLNELETTYRGNIITISDTMEMENVMLYSTKPRELLIAYKSVTTSFPVIESIKLNIYNYIKVLDLIDIGNQPIRMSKGLRTVRDPNKKSAVKLLLCDFLFQLDEYGIYAASIAIVSVLVEIDLKRRQAETLALRNLYRAVITLCESIRHRLVLKLNDMADEDEANTDIDKEDIIMNFSTPKVQTFLNFLKQTFSGKKATDICCLVFVERRYTCKCIYGVVLKFIEATPSLKNVLAPQFMVGRNGICQDFESILEARWQKSAIQQFRQGESNLMICSSVLEEGIDMQACNYVLILDPIKTFNMYVQTKGRARSKDATFILFAPEVYRDKLALQIGQYRKAHIEIADYLKSRVLERSEPQADEIEKHFQCKIQPYINKSGSVLLPSSAITLLHRYCQQIPSDAFGIVLPWFKLLDGEEHKKFTSDSRKHIASVELPLSSTMRETVYSDPMPSSRDAKISAAFKTCIKLYNLGELNERFLPATANDMVAEIANGHFEHWNKYNDNVTAKRKDRGTNYQMTYDTKCPTEFYDAMPRVGEICYAYEITVKPLFECNDYTQHMYESLKTNRNYALLLRNRLPLLAEMPIFNHQGEMRVNVADVPIEILIDDEHKLKMLQNFHVMVFRDILRVWQPFFVLDRRSKENSYLLVPLASSGIDWPLIEQFPRLPTPQSTNVKQRTKQPPPRAEDFVGRIVTQWYASYENKRMLVTKVHTDLTPMSMMEEKQQNNSYYKFTMAKYGSYIEDVVHKDHFLIEVRELTDQLNYYIQQRVKSSAVTKSRSKVMLIPELCFNFGFPGDLWIKSLLLPSILRRVYYMLHAETLRKRINKYLDLDTIDSIGAGYKPQPLEIDWSLSRNVDYQGNAIHNADCEEPRPVLEPLPSQSIQNSIQKLEITDLDVPWQKYMEPLDIHRNIMSLYPIELSYYYNFTSGGVLDTEKLEAEGKEAWSQFNMPSKIYGNKNTSDMLVPSILPTGGPNAKRVEEVHLSVLQRSISKEHIKPAEQGDFLAAITYAGSVDVFDMERFELLGDCFLKLSATLYLANKYPNWNEGILTQVKSTLVSNRNLLYCLSDTDIPTRICNTLFSPKYTWMPPSISLPYNMISLWKEEPTFAALIGPHNLRHISLSDAESLESGNCNKDTYESFLNDCKSNQFTHHAGEDFSGEINFCVNRTKMPDKLLADTLEAILGVVVKNYGLQYGFRMLEYFKIFKPDIGKPLTRLLDLQLGGARMRTNISETEVDGFLINHTYLEQNLGYTFRDRAYLLQSLTHPSNPTNRLTGSYQELEFIGDAILDFLISAYIFEHKTRMTPGQLTDLRSALVNNTTLACICVRHRFHLFILAENALLSEAIQNFSHYQQSNGHRVTNQVRILMEESDVKSHVFDTDDGVEDDENNSDMKNTEAQENQKPPIAATAAKSVQSGAYNISHNVDVPKALGDIVEALIAAVYLDSRDLHTTWQVVYKLFEPELLEFSRSVPVNSIRQLYEHKLAKPSFGAPVIDGDNVMVTCEFTCMENIIKVHGFGCNGKQAKLAAAKHALQKLSKCEA